MGNTAQKSSSASPANGSAAAASNPLRSMAASRVVRFDNVPAHFTEMLEKELVRAEVGLCDYNLVISVRADSKSDFVVAGSTVVFNEHVFSNQSTLRVHLRHAIELAIWLQFSAAKLDSVHAAAIALLSAAAARRFYLLMPTDERTRILDELPEWLRETASASEKEVFDTLAGHLDALMPLQNGAVESNLDPKQLLELVSVFAPIANPTEYILTQQGDERLLIDPATGLNKYGCSPRPRPEAITFSSCTASSVSEFAYREAELLRHRLMQALADGNPAPQYELEIENVRGALRELLHLEADTEIILSSSGTDAELYPLVLLRTREAKKLINIVVAPDEVGSGTVLAAGGRHFSSRAPLGASVKQGEPINGLDPVEVVSVPIRDSSGEKIEETEFRRRISAAVSDAVGRADKVILHIVDNSKTGVVAPDAEIVGELKKKFGARLDVLVDACQLRLERRNLIRYLEQGFWVLVTGSKFFTGPPFGGALLIPRFQPADEARDFPAGFSDFFTRSELSRQMRSRGENLSEELNLGLLFRWTGAIKEMNSFYTVPPETRTAVLKRFRTELIKSIRDNPDLLLFDCPEPRRWSDADGTLWDALPTIFSFAVRDPRPQKSGKWMPLADLKKIYYLLNRDCSAHLPSSASEAERRLAAQRCHIGQPVTIGRCADSGDTNAIRIACGARLVYGITHDDSLGDSTEARFNRELTDAQTVLKKVSLILKYWEALRHEEGFNEAACVMPESDHG